MKANTKGLTNTTERAFGAVVPEHGDSDDSDPDEEDGNGSQCALFGSSCISVVKSKPATHSLRRRPHHRQACPFTKETFVGMNKNTKLAQQMVEHVGIAQSQTTTNATDAHNAKGSGDTILDKDHKQQRRQRLYGINADEDIENIRNSIKKHRQGRSRRLLRGACQGPRRTAARGLRRLRLCRCRPRCIQRLAGPSGRARQGPEEGPLL